MSSTSEPTQIEHTYELLIGTMMQSKHRLVELAGEFSITGMQAIMVLLLKTPCPMNGFLKVLNCDASNITGIVDGLEQRDLATRFPSQTDRRIKMVRLTPDGEKLRDHFIKLLVEDKESNLFRLEPSELKTFNNLLEKIAGTTS